MSHAAPDGYSNHSRSVSPKPVVEDKSKNSATVSNFLQRNYHKENKKKAEKERKGRELKEQEDRAARENAIP